MRWLSDHAAQVRIPSIVVCHLWKKLYLCSPSMTCMVLKKAQHTWNTKSQTGEECLAWAVWLRELLGDFIELFSSVETSLALWSCSPVLSPINCGMPLVEKSILVFSIHDKYVQICMALKEAQHGRNTKSQPGGQPCAVWLRELLVDFIEICSSVETSLALCLWSCNPGSNHINRGMPLVEKSTLVFANHDKYITIWVIYFTC